MCEKHVDSDIIHADELVVNVENLSLKRDELLLKPGATPKKFDSFPAYLTKPKQRSLILTKRFSAKRRPEWSSCGRETKVPAKPGTLGAASCHEGDKFLAVQ